MAANNKVIVIMLCLFCCIGIPEKARCNTDSSQVRDNYGQAYGMLCKMLQARSPDFKTAVYYVENAWYGNLSFAAFDQEIKRLALLSKAYLSANPIKYTERDSANVGKMAAVFKIMTDSIPLQQGDQIVYHQPYTYNFSDFDGSAAWPDMFVSALMETHTGNCHSMPFLYKMIMQEMGSNAWLALAPNHIYIKLYCAKDGWFNTELTSAEFPIDAWIMASGYVHLNAIQNAVYMDTLSDTKSIAMCLVDLAQGYEAKLKGGNADSFILKCCDTALTYFPDYINALLLQAKVYERQFSQAFKASGLGSPQAFIESDPGARMRFDRMTALAGKIHDMGYRKMPTKMYLEWLGALNTQKDKYSNKKIINFTN